MAIGLGLCDSLALGGFDLLGGGPVAVDQFPPEPLPGEIAGRVDADDFGEVGLGLAVKSVLLGPDGQFPAIVGGLARGGSAGFVLGERGGQGWVGSEPLGDLIGPSPAAVDVLDVAEEPTGDRLVGVGHQDEREVLEPLGGHPILLAPEHQVEMRLRIAPGHVGGCPIGFPDLRIVRGRWNDRDEDQADDEGVQH